MAEQKIIGRVSVKVIPEVAKRRMEMRKDIEDQLDDVAKRVRKRKPVKIPAEVDKDGVVDSVDDAVTESEKKSIRLRIGADYDDVMRGMDKVRSALKDLGRDTIKVNLDEDSLNKELERLQESITDSPVHMRISDDVEGDKEVLKKIDAIRREASMKEVSFNVDPDSLDAMEREIRDRIDQATGPRTLDVDVDLSSEDSVRDALKQIDKELSNLRAVNIPVEVNEEDLNEARERLLKLLPAEEIKQGLDDALKPRDLKIRVDTDSQRSVNDAIAKIDQQLSDLKAIDFEVGLDKESLIEARRKLEKFREDGENKEIDVPVNLTGLGLAAARIRWVTRPRTVTIFAKVNEKSVLVAEGILKSLAGLGAMQRIGTMIQDTIINFDRFAVKSTFWMAAIGNLTNVLGYMVTTLFTVGGGLAQTVGILNMIPTLLAAIAAATVINIMAWKNFGDAVDGDAKALAALPPIAREAAKALKGTWTQIQRPVQKAFWDGMGTSLQDAVLEALPVLRKGLSETAVHMGRFSAEVLDEFRKIARNGDMQIMFKNLARGFDNLADAAAPFTEALNTLGLRGSYFLPRLGRWFADMAEDFNDWVQESEEAGKINMWIEDAITAFKDTGRAINGITRQFRALTQIIDAAGGQKLSGFATNMQSWADVMEREPFRSRMERIFRGARIGAGELNEGFKQLTDTIGAASDFTGTLLIQLGRIGGGVLKRIADGFGEIGFQVGVASGLEKVIRAIDDLAPAAEAFGRTIGTMFDVSGSVIEGIVPLLNDTFRILDVIARELAPTFKDLIPILTGFVRNILVLTEGPLQLMADLLAIVTDGVSALPGPLQNLTLAFGTFLLLRGQLGGMLSSLNTFWNGQRTVMRGGVAAVTTNAQRFKEGIMVVPASVNDATRRTNMARGKLAGAVNGVGRTVGGLGSALGRIVTMGGGLGGVLLFTGIIAAITAVGDAAAKERDRIEEFKGTLNEAGESTSKTREMFAELLAGTSASTPNGTKAYTEILEGIGLSAGNATRALAGTRAQYESFIAFIKDAEKAQEQIQIGASRAPEGDPLGQLDANRAADAASRRQALQQLRADVEAQRIILEKARREVELTAKAMDTSVVGAKTFQEAMDIISDAASGADDKVSALKRALDVLNGGMISKQEAAIQLADDIRGIRSAIEEATEKQINLQDLIEDDGTIDVTIDADPTGMKAKVAQQLQEGVSSAMELALASVQFLPEEQKTAAFAAAYEKALSSIKAEIAPELGQGDWEAWLTANGFDLITVQALIEGNASPEALGQMNEEIRTGIEGWFGQNPVRPAIGADKQELDEKMGVAQEQLGIFANGHHAPKLDADAFPLNNQILIANQQLEVFRTGSATTTLDANRGPVSNEILTAEAQLEVFRNGVHEPTFGARPGPFKQEVREAQAEGARLEAETFKPKVDAEPKEFYGKTNKVEVRGEALARQNYEPSISLYDQAFINGVTAANQAGRNLDMKIWRPVLDIWTDGLPAVGQALRTLQSFKRNYKSTLTISVNGGMATGFGALMRADGGVNAMNVPVNLRPSSKVTAFANGGFTKPSSAHIAPGGSNILYAERETGGEAFIPLAANKRGRSLDIWKETGKRLGAFADGGVTGRGSTESAINLNIEGAAPGTEQAIADAMLFALRHERRGGKY